MEKEYYNSDRINTENALYNIIISGRSDGKSYDIKRKFGIFHYLKTGRRFILLRRKASEILTADIEQYFCDIDVLKETDGKYEGIVAYRKDIYFGNMDEKTKKIKPIEKIGYARSLSTEQNYAGHQYPDVDNIIFEEFMSRDSYLRKEPEKLFNFYCTVDRKRGTTRMWLLGNNITRVCPYLKDWGLIQTVKTQKQGEISVFYRNVGFDENGKDVSIKLAVELGKDLKRTSFTFGESSEMMNTGKWQTAKQPHLPKSYKDYRKNLTIVFKFKGFCFLGEFLTDKNSGECCWFIRPKNNENIKKNTIVVSDEVNISPFYIRDIYNPTIKKEKIRKILSSFREGKIFYCNDLTGTDFKQAIDFEIRR